MNRCEQELGVGFYFVLLVAIIIAGAMSVFVENVAGAVFFGFVLHILTR